MMSEKLFNNFKNNKAASGKIPIHILEESEFTFETFTNCINRSIENAFFRDSQRSKYQSCF